MKRKRIVGLALVFGLLGGSIAFAAAADSPAAVLAQITGMTADEAYQGRLQGEPYGKMAVDAGTLEEFQDNMLKYRKQIIDERVEQGLMTQEEADAWLEAYQERIEYCTEAGVGGPGYGCGGAGIGFGRGGFQGQGFGRGMMRGFGY